MNIVTQNLIQEFYGQSSMWVPHSFQFIKDTTFLFNQVLLNSQSNNSVPRSYVILVGQRYLYSHVVYTKFVFIIALL